ncbi:Multidrug resistance-associated protein [Paratrimastix pyriformis]|uniref:Multidrug resistance-associated protein n=1 Tax=Paratrimastix pyriformis TaxID=342808 RepID=A0ABQ8UMA8_9EUKA|nr:Multidrug resistance-associated protein [Paratrimastix pyriformis]
MHLVSFYGFLSVNTVQIPRSTPRVLRLLPGGFYRPWLPPSLALMSADTKPSSVLKPEEKPQPQANVNPAPKNPEQAAWFLNRCLFLFFCPVIFKGMRKPLGPSDIWQVHDADRADKALRRLKQFWRPKYERYHRERASYEDALKAYEAQLSTLQPNSPQPKRPSAPSKPSMVMTLISVAGWRFWWGAFLCLAQYASQLIAPLTLQPLIEAIFYLRSGDPTFKFPIGYAVLFCISSFIMGLCQSNSERHTWHVASRLRVAMMAGVYDKVLHLNNASSSQTDSGQMITLISADARNATDTMVYLHYVWAVPCLLVAAVVLVFYTIGWAGLPPLVLMLVCLPFQSWIGKKVMDATKNYMAVNDERVKVTNETVQGIRVVKFTGLEDTFANRIRESRLRQSVHLQSSYYYRSFMVLLFKLVPTFVNVAAFVAYPLMYGNASPAIIFTAMAYLGLISHPLSLLPMAFTALAQAIASSRRVGDFLLLPERQDDPDVKRAEASRAAGHVDPTVGIAVRNATFRWAEPPKLPPPVPEMRARESLANQLLAEWKRQAKACAQRGVRPPPHPPGAAEIPDVIMLPILVKMGIRKKGDLPSSSAAPSPAASPEPQTTTSPVPLPSPPPAAGPVSRAAAMLEAVQQAIIDEAAPKAARPPTLRGIDFVVPKGTLTMVIGHVGCGKSSLASALIGEITRVEGDVTVNGSLSFCAQQAWITNATVRENILFGLPYDEEKYKRCVEACALLPDFKIMAAGDQTAIGEKGVNLSGGQKQRISLARSVYSGRDVYLWDDPLSAVDVHVGKHIFERAIKGLLAGKTMVLITNQLQFLDQADQVIVLKEGTIEAKGSMAELVASGFDMTKYSVKITAGPSTEDDVTRITPTPAPGPSPCPSPAPSAGTSAPATAAHAAAENPDDTRKAEEGASGEADEGKKAALTLISEEEQQTGAIAMRSYGKYLGTYSGLAGWVAVLALWVIVEGSSTVMSWWLQQWTSDVYLAELGLYYPLLIYAMIGVFQALVGVFRALGWVQFSTRSAKLIHEGLVNRIVRAPTSFFDTTPVDMQLSGQYEGVLNLWLDFVATLVVVGLGSPWFFVVMVPILGLFWLLLTAYRASSRELQRIESIARSPCFSHFNETLTGLPTLRSYGLVDRWTGVFHEKCDRHSSSYVMFRLGQKWMGLWQSVISVLLVVGAVLLYVFLDVSSAVSFILAQAVVMFVQLESLMTSIERIQSYSETVPQEMHEGIVPPAGWPQTGVIKFDKVSFRYRAKLPLVLKGADFEIRSNEKVGVVGRTGAGKSSLLVVLFRLVELGGATGDGRILLDGIDIAKVQLNLLRQHIAIIPQDPVLFSGSLRYNLDLAMTHEDSEIWRVLEHIYLKDFVSSLKDKLDTQITEGGTNLSVGQRQLLCLGRALLHSSKVVVMDEATANVDTDTDNAIQRTIRECFADRTVIIIAHRINTVMGCDRVMVMDAGKVAEFDNPQLLMANPASRFACLVASLNHTGNEEPAAAVTPVPQPSR